MPEKKTAKPKTKEVGGRPKKHVAPATTARKKELERIANDNKHIARRLKSVKREPVSSFHAPNGNPSLKLKGQKVEDDRPVEAWPIKLVAPSTSQRKARNQQIASDNKVMLKQFNETLSLNKNSFVVSNKLGDGKDCRPMWEKRTSIYNPESPLDMSLSVSRSKQRAMQLALYLKAPTILALPLACPPPLAIILDATYFITPPPPAIPRAATHVTPLPPFHYSWCN
ncbi:hypothetical protein CYMTET_18957 [Cymbomonas tetramitiformis]|uniref:Uncharacterized protein n=1 Tax=Cymbomonas tetramitiformis TaxID=36881 RepID=A0AAE0G8D7_9CHLO|nr:hypothetical protein CYMTET_18957 [Cymbomonas tetramitiformis]